MCFYITLAPLDYWRHFDTLLPYKSAFMFILCLGCKCFNILSVVRSGGCCRSLSVGRHLGKFESVGAGCVESSAVWEYIAATHSRFFIWHRDTERADGKPEWEYDPTGSQHRVKGTVCGLQQTYHWTGSYSWLPWSTFCFEQFAVIHFICLDYFFRTKPWM